MNVLRYWKAIFDTLTDAVLVIDSAGTVLAMNPAAERLTGYQARELVGASCRVLECTGCEVIAQGRAEQWCGLFAIGDVTAKKCRITNKEHRSVQVIKNAAVLRGPDGNVVGAVETLRDMSDFVRQQQEIRALKRTLHMGTGFHGIIGDSPTVRALCELIESVALTESHVLIYGESGTGKELVARAIHEASARSDKPFVKVSCAALNQNLLESELFGHARGAYTGAIHARVGRFEAAHTGTILLDEVGDIPLDTQVKLLRVLEERDIERVGDQTPIKVDVRVISATNRNLEDLIARGLFREDLYFRINVFPLRCPPLREHPEDIPKIARQFIGLNGLDSDRPITGLSAQAMERLMAYPWPGNVRELRNAIEYAFVLCWSRAIGTEHLPPRISRWGEDDNQGRLVERLAGENERQCLVEALRQAGGNQSEAARILGISRVTVWKRMRKHGIDLARTIREPPTGGVEHPTG